MIMIIPNSDMVISSGVCVVAAIMMAMVVGRNVHISYIIFISYVYHLYYILCISLISHAIYITYK